MGERALTRPSGDARGQTDLPRIRGALLLLTVALVGSVGFAELLLRVTRPQAVGVSRLPLLYRPDPEKGYAYLPKARGRFQTLFEVDNEVHTNARGYHDAPRPPRRCDRSVVALGDSYTAALQVPVPETWTQQLERALGRRVPDVRVLNRGLDGTGTHTHLVVLGETLEEVEPALVLLAFFANDLGDVRAGRVLRDVRAGYVIQAQDEQQAARMRALAERMRGRWLRHGLFDALYVVRFGVYLALGGPNLYRTNVISPGHVGEPVHRRSEADAVAELRQLLREFEALAKSRGFHLAVVPVPGPGSPHGSLRVFQRVAGPLALDVVDVVPPLRRRLAEQALGFTDLYGRYDGHLSRHGNRLFAEALVEPLAKRLSKTRAPVDCPRGGGAASPSHAGPEPWAAATLPP